MINSVKQFIYTIVPLNYLFFYYFYHVLCFSWLFLINELIQTSVNLSYLLNMFAFNELLRKMAFLIPGNVIGITLRTEKKYCPQNIDEIESKFVSVDSRFARLLLFLCLIVTNRETESRWLDNPRLVVFLSVQWPALGEHLTTNTADIYMCQKN